MEPVQIAKVRLLATTAATDREFDYLCPGTVPAARGSVVKIPFGKGNRERIGVVTRVESQIPDRSLKSILSVFPPEISLNEEMMELCDHLKEQIFCSFGEAARAILPSPVYRSNAKKIRFLSLSQGVDPEHCLDSFRGKNKEKYADLIRYLSLVETAPEKVCRELFSLDSGAFSRLTEKGILTETEQDEIRNPLAQFEHLSEEPSSLSPEQQEAFEALRKQADRGEASCALLHGVTGSGKTRVMLALCDYVLSQGKTVLFLVPEIALTGQSAVLLASRYREKVAVIHSALSEGERRDSYVAISRGDKPVVLGTRSAVFAPLKNLGLIVLDEEHDSSYKSDTQLKYHARDVARFRCAKNRAMLLLATATPDVESYYKAKTEKYSLVSLTGRYGTAKLPTVRVADLRPDLRINPSLLLGSALREEMKRNLDQGEQTILLMNRRGYRRFLACSDCGTPIRCPHCSVSLTVHNGKEKKLSCHYCGYASVLPSQCPECGGEHLHAHGFGIQQLEEEIGETFPSARVLRMDSDSLTGKTAHEDLLAAFRNKEADILIGTQMVAKGHNFPDVTLVGVVMADSALYLSDYRAGEHCFSLLTQVIGRAGRAQKEGRAIIQTLNPMHNIFSLAARQDYEAFYEGEIALRKGFLFPPFCQLAVFHVASEEERALQSACQRLSDALSQALSSDFSDVKVVVYGPFEAPVYRMKNVYRKRFILKYKNNARTRALFHRILQIASQEPTAKITLDINPGLI